MERHLLATVGVFGCALAAMANWEPYQQQALQAVVRAARVLDPASGRYSGPSIVVVRNGTIERVESAGQSAARESATIDLGDLTLMPRLIDGHVHLQLGGESAAANAEATLSAGSKPSSILAREPTRSRMQSAPAVPQRPRGRA
jgi:imidazolonepropionase-like amidohydrolase